MLRPWLDPLSELTTLVYFDAEGGGQSSRPDDASTLGISRWVHNVELLRQARGDEQIILFGHSSAGVVAVEYAAAYPSRVAGLILCGTYAVFSFADKLMARMSRHVAPELLQSAFAGPIADDETFAEVFPRILPGYFHAWPPDNGGDVLRDVRYSADALNRSLFGDMASHDATPRLGAIQAPTLVIGGDDDAIMPVEEAYTPLVTAIPNATGVLIEDCGHFPFAERPDAFVDAVTSWLRSALRSE